MVRILDYIKAEYGNYEGLEEFNNLDFDQKWQYLTDWMTEVTGEITELAGVIAEYRRNINEQSEGIASLAKDVIAVDMNKKLIRNVLKTGMLPKKLMFTKEQSKLKELTKALQMSVIYT